MMIDEIKLLVDLFESSAPDNESNRMVWQFCDDKQKWTEAHDLVSTLKEKNIKAIMQGDKIKEFQYGFEEAVAKTLFNLTTTDTPFDADAPYWVIKNALSLAKALNIPVEKVVNIIA